MAKDYGRSRQARRGNSGSKQFLMILLSFLIGYLTASMFDFISLSQWVNAKIAQQGSVAPMQVAAKATPLPKPKFEFYTLLANGSTATHNAPPAAKPPVVAAVKPITSMASQPIQLTENKPVSNPITVASNNKETYIIQVGSFKTHPEAERMKAGLILKGFSANIIPVTQGQVVWHRVIIGPYANHVDAQKAQVSFARSEHVTGMIRKNA